MLWIIAVALIAIGALALLSFTLHVLFSPWLLAVAISVLFFFMFEVWFQVPLFKGYWNLTGWTGF